MTKRTMMALFLSAFLIVGETHAMNEMPPPPPNPNKKDMTDLEKENAQKMMLLNEHMKSMDAQQKDIQGVIGGKLHELSKNPVLNGTLVRTILDYRSEDLYKEFPFKIRGLVKGDVLDLSKIYGDDYDNLYHAVFTTDPGVFFADHGHNVVVLIAPKTLIHDTLSSSSAPFAPIMADWDQTKAPIGIFWRYGSWEPKNYNYLTNATPSAISTKSLVEWLDHRKDKGDQKGHVRGYGRWHDNRPNEALMNVYRQLEEFAFKFD